MTVQLAPDRRYVLYWMTAFRRLSSNFALQHAVNAARDLGRPLVILEALRADYPHASDRLHRFVIDGMAEHARALSGLPVTYLPYVEPARGAGRGLLEALARDAALVVADDYPCFFLPRMIAAAAQRIDARLEAVDSNGLLPMRATDRTFLTAHSFRAHLQRELPPQLGEWPAAIDLSDLPAAPGDLLAPEIAARWAPTAVDDLNRPDRLLASLPIDHRVAHRAHARRLGAGARGAAAVRRGAPGGIRRRSLASRCARHERALALAALRAHLVSRGLRGGHDVGALDVAEAVEGDRRCACRLVERVRRRGGISRSADHLARTRLQHVRTRPDDYASYESLPAWAQATLEAHASDPREHLYTLDQFERAETHDEVWNAAQRQLTRDGWMHNYLRMLWAKKILEWTASPREALATMIALMDKHSVDGRDPNSYTGYCWTLGRYDRPWGPERPIFGTIRYMSSANTVKKLKMKEYLRQYGGQGLL